MTNSEKELKPFRWPDLIIYLGIAAILVSLIFIFTASASGYSSTAYCDVSGTHIFSYDFTLDRINYYDSAILSVSDRGSTTEITLSFGDEYNLIVIDHTEKEIYMKEATCSHSHDCTYMGPVKKSGGIIVCIPHSLKIYCMSSGPVLG